MTAMTYRWERERAAHLLAGSRAGTDRRRRAELLARAARRGARTDTGVGQSALVDEITPSRWRRMTTDEDGSRPLGKKIRVGFGYAVVGAVAGAGLAVGRGLYEGLVGVSPRIGRLLVWPWVAAAGALAGVLVLAGVPFGFGLRMDRRFPLSLLHYGPWPAWVMWQLAIALVTVGYHIWAWGWAGVPSGAVAPPEKNRDGSFQRTPDRQKVRLDHDGEDDAPAESAPPNRPRREIPLVRLDHDDEDDGLDAMYGDLSDNEEDGR